jgi:hypothetical protein
MKACLVKPDRKETLRNELERVNSTEIRWACVFERIIRIYVMVRRRMIQTKVNDAECQTRPNMSRYGKPGLHPPSY